MVSLEDTLDAELEEEATLEEVDSSLPSSKTEDTEDDASGLPQAANKVIAVTKGNNLFSFGFFSFSVKPYLY